MFPFWEVNQPRLIIEAFFYSFLMNLYLIICLDRRPRNYRP